MSSPARSTSYRLLYRGALSLPDSHLLLDGLTFAARLNAGNNLLDNPLALALESMRGRPTLRFMGITNLKDIYMDASGDITMDIHSQATLSWIYFENTFCLTPLPTDKTGVRVALGDSDGPETTEMVIFAEPVLPNPASSEKSNAQGPPPIQLTVARITPAPMPTTTTRLPRPDDPTPRKPPPLLLAKGRDLRRVGSSSLSAPLGGHKRQKLSHPVGDSSLAGGLGSGVRLGANQAGMFKVPLVPVRNGTTKGKGKEKAIVVEDDGDVFGDIGVMPKTDVKRVGESKAKKKAGENGSSVGESQLERENKDIIKRAAARLLKQTPISKAHPEYKEIYGWVYRGVGFALRADMKTRPVEQKMVDRLAKMHVEMYSGGLPGVDDDGTEMPR